MDPYNLNEELNKENYFNQKIPYSYDNIIKSLEETLKDLDHLQPLPFLSAVYEFTKGFNLLSTALGFAFSDITEKVDIWRKLFRAYPNCKDMQAVMLLEIEENIQELNGSNNSSKGHSSKSKYYSYVSGCRTMVRLSWFLNFMMRTLKNINTTDQPFNKCIKEAYMEILAPHHPWVVRTAASAALRFLPKDKEPAVKIFIGEIPMLTFRSD